MLKSLSSTHSRYLANCVIVLAVIVCLFRIYQTSLLWWPVKSTTITSPALPLKPITPKKISYDLFGVYRAKLADDIPNSQLNIDIIGLFYSTDPKKSHVILSIDGQAQKVYAKGDVLSDGVVIYRIHRDGIVLKREGQLESLRLKKEALEFQAPPKGFQAN